MNYKVYESRPRTGTQVRTYEADSLQEAVEIIAKEHDDNQRNSINRDNTFRLVKVVTREDDIPFRISIGGTESTIATVGSVTVSA